jgi:transcriptional regulator with XRE-family HTH domain
MKFKATHFQTPRWATLIRAERKRLGLSQTEFGALFGVTHTTVSNWEKESATPNAQMCWWLYRKLERKLDNNER